MTTKNIETLWQVFTPEWIVDRMIALIKNHWKILEPSCWDWAFTSHLPDSIWIEYDPSMAKLASNKNNNIINMDFFDYSTNNKFDTIIWNPPYVRFQDIDGSTKEKLDLKHFDKRSNLYLFFIDKCIKHLNDWWELIFINPRDFLKATSSINLNNYIYSQGTITDIIDLWDQKVFDGATPNVIIWRFEKGNFSRITNVSKNFMLSNWQLLFTQNSYDVKFSDVFFVKVWAVSWADSIFSITDEILEEYPDIPVKEFVWSFTAKKWKTKRMLYNELHPYLNPYKNQLINRKIKHFWENDWWKWWRWYYESDKKRIYVNWKTRNKNPFFVSDVKNYDGSVLAIFPYRQDLDVNEMCDALNKVDREELWFVCDWRFLFSQKSLENTILPENFKKYIRNDRLL